MDAGFPHERLDCYRLAVGVARWTLARRFPPRCGDLADQSARAAASIPLNIAEACRGGAAGKNHYRIAMGSAGERCAVLDVVDLLGHPKVGASFEGFAVGKILRRLGADPDEAYFRALHSGDRTFPLAERIRAVAISRLHEDVAPLGS